MSLNCYFPILIACQILTVSFAIKGSIPLDSDTYDKVLSKFKTSLVKFDIQYPYGEKHDEYTNTVNSLKNNDEILLAEVGVQDYGDNENQDLADRYQLKKDDYPKLMLFKNGDLTKPIVYTDEEFKANNILKFVRANTGIRIVLDNCIEELDEIAEQFMATGAQRDKLLSEAKEKLNKVKENQQKFANVYLNVMQRVVERGDKFVDSEKERVKNLIAGKISETKKKEMEGRLNILQSFKVYNTEEVKTEL